MPTKRFITLCILPLLLFAGCSAGGENTTAARHVILIGLDGWGAYSVEKADIPQIKQMMAEGSHTLEARSVLPSSSACNWASMFMGAGPELHGYTAWDSRTPDLEPRTVDTHGFFPTIFSLLYDQSEGARIGLMYEWDGIGYLCPKDVLDTDRHIPATEGNSEGLARAAARYIFEEKPQLLVVAFDEPDGTGHREGHATESYYAKLRELDACVGTIRQAVRDAGIEESTVIIITADHGGIDKGHGGMTMQEMQIPFIACGKGIRAGHRITSSAMIYDTAATIAEILGLERPQVWTGRPLWEIFEPGHTTRR